MSSGFLRWMFPRDAHQDDGLHATLERFLPATGQVLDLGCGAHRTLERYRTDEREVWGADFERHAELQEPKWVRLLGADGRVPFADDNFDLVASIMVMEHVEDPQAYFAEVFRVLRPGGCFIGQSVSGNHYVTWLRRLIGVLPHRFNQWLVKKLYGRAEIDTFPAHYRLNRRSDIESARGGLEMQQMTHYADAGYFRFFRPVQWSAILLDRLLATIAPSWGRLYFTVILRKPVQVSKSFSEESELVAAN